MINISNEHNEKLLNRYKMLCKQKALTEETIKAFCEIDLPLFFKFIGDKNVEDVTHIDVEDFFEYCLNERNNQPQTLNRKFVSINVFYKTMIRKQYLTCSNPMDRIDTIKTRKRIKEHLTPEEIQQIMDYLESINDLRGLAMISLLFSSGIRLSELHQLNIDSFDMETRRFSCIGKGDKQRNCIFSENAKQHILNYLESRTDDNPWLFQSRQNTRLAKKSLQDYIKRIGINAKINKNVHMHITRHSFITASVNAGKPLQSVSLLAGHSNVQTTMGYFHDNLNNVQNELDNLNIF